MPHLEGLLRTADWGGRAVAASSWGGPAMASLFTGLRPWQHQAIHGEQAALEAELTTLPAALKALGYETAGFTAGHWCSEGLGYARGFDVFEPLGRGRHAADRLAGLRGGRQLVWVHIPEPQPPWVAHPEMLARLGPDAPEALPQRLLPEQLQPFFDPAAGLPPQRHRRFWAMYQVNAAWADERLGRLLAALRESGQWDRTLLVVTASHGEEFGEKGQILDGGNLGRQLLEVPLAIRLPAGFAPRLAEPRDRRVAAARLWATLVEAAGGTPPPAAAPSLFRRDPAPILSELYLTDGTNRFSLLAGDEQLLAESAFAPPEPLYYRALEMAGQPDAAARLGEPPAAVLARLGAAFDATPPLSGTGGTGALRLSLERWEAQGGTRPLDDPRRAAELARLLVRSWGRFVPDELSPAAEEQEWKLARRSG